MVIRVYITGISGSKEIKKRQQRALMILDSLKVRYETVDLSEPGHDDEKEHMKSVCKKRGNQQQAHPPQFFNEDVYCGDYEDFEAASDDDTVLSFLKIEDREDVTIENGEISSGSIQGNHHVNNSIEGDERNQGDGMEGDGMDGDGMDGDVIEEDEQVIVEEKMVLKRGGIQQEIQSGMTPEQMIQMIKSGKNQIIEEQQFETQKTEKKIEEPEEGSEESDEEESQESKPKQESQPIESQPTESKDEPEDEEMSSEESEE